VAAEVVGMTGAAAAAVVAGHRGDSTAARVLALAVIVAGGLVEGLALGWFQSRALGEVLGDRQRVWLWGTVLVAGLGWAAASAPSALGGADAGGSGPPWWLVGLGAVGLGLLLGAVLGAVQARALRPQVSHAGRWVGVSALAWAPTMFVIFVGAGWPSDTWPDAAVLASGPLTGAVAGFALGRTSGWLLPSMSGAKPHDLLVLRLLAGPARHVLGSGLVGLRTRGVVSGRTVELPVMYAGWGSLLVVVPGHADRKRWWHNVENHTTEVEVLINGRWASAVAEVLSAGSPSYDSARSAYATRWPKASLPTDQPLVVLYGVPGS